MNILLFGPPGAGKGTQSNYLIQKLKMIQISTGDLFRNAIKNKTELGIQAKSYMDKGELVPDVVVTGMVADELKKVFSADKNSNVILDGFPRTVQQAESLDVIFSNIKASLDFAIFINVDNELLVDRLVGRRVCKSCGAVYHVKTSKPAVSGKCDKCNGDLYQRSDDKEEVIKDRLDIYNKSSKELADFYKKKKIYKEIDGLGTSEEVFTRLSKILER